LDEDDLELIQENEGFQPQHKRLRKKKELEVEEDELKEPSLDEENDDFIEKDFDEPVRPKKGKVRRNEGFNVLQMVFGSGYEYGDEAAGDEEDKKLEEDIPEEERRLLNKKKFDQLFDPAELQDKFATFADEQVIAEDIPERLQFRYKNRFCDNNELVQETNWIADRLIQEKNLVNSNSENFRKNIMKVLEFLRIYFYEIMYIHTYKANEISLKPGELKLQDLWKIYDLDMEWAGIWSRRKLLEKSLEKLGTFMQVPDIIKQLANISFDKFTLDNLLDYCEFQTLLNPEASSANEIQQISETQTFKKAKRVLIKPEIKQKFDHFCSRYLITPDQFAMNLHENKQRFAPPMIEELLTDVANRNYVDESIPKLSSPETFLTQLCDYVAQLLFRHPMIRKIVRRMYFEKVLVSTEPTPKGRNIDMYNINYCVKRIEGRSINQFRGLDDVWLRAVKCEKDGLIRIKLHFRWKDFNSDEIFNFLKNFYLLDPKMKNEATSQWNILRIEILTILLKNYLYPFLEKQVRQDMTENAEKKIIQECGKKFKDMINIAPYTKSEGDGRNPDIKVASLIPDENGKIICAIVDKYGEYLDHRIFNYLLINEKRAPLEFINKHQHEEEELKKFMDRYVPDLLVVGAENLSAKTLIKYLRDQTAKWSQEVRNVWIKYGDMTVPKIYAKMEVSKREFRDHPIRLKEAISLARLQQSPLHETLKLWHHRKEENGILYIVLHDLQNSLNTEKLLKELEKAAIEVTNQVGIDINKIMRHLHLSYPLQFVCGLGPRKAKHILDSLTQRFPKLTLRRELTEEKLVNKNVFTNMAGFIKVVDEEGEVDLLDTTRIHPNDYRLAQKIAKDALDDVEVKTDDYIKTIMEKPQKLDELDLDDYAAHLESKGKQNMKIVLDFIVKELTRPFDDPRAPKEMDHQDLFYKMTKTHPFELQHGSLVNARITRVNEKNLICKLECGIDGIVFSQDALDSKDPVTDLTSKFHEGQVVTARVFKTNFDEKSGQRGKGRDGQDHKDSDFTKIQLALKKSVVDDHKSYIKKLHKSIDNHTFRIVDEEDFPQVQTAKAQSTRYIARKINHPKFKNTSGQGALEYLEDKEIGDYVIRPSSRGTDHLTITWKFYKNVYVHLDIKESPKGPNDKIGRKLFLKDQAYESLDELIAGYIQPCNVLVNSIIQSNKFSDENPTRIEEIIKQEKEENPKFIPYRFGFSVEAPQYLVLYYAPKDYNVVTEYIKVKQNGLLFHDNIFQNLSFLISWFKSNYHKPEYHKFLKHYKPPIAIPKAIQPKGERYDSYGQGLNTPTHLGRAFDDNIRIKTERDDFRVKSEKGFDDRRGHNRDRSHERFGKGKFGGDRRDDRNRDKGRGRKDRSRSRSREKESNRDKGRYDRDDRHRDSRRDRDDRRGPGHHSTNKDRRDDRRGGQDSRRKDDYSKPQGGWGKPAGWEETKTGGNPNDGWGQGGTNDGWGEPGELPNPNQWGSQPVKYEEGTRTEDKGKETLGDWGREGNNTATKSQMIPEEPIRVKNEAE